MNCSSEFLNEPGEPDEYTSVEQIKQAQLKPHREALEIAHLQLKSDSHSRAVETLKECCHSGIHEAVIHLALGDILIAKVSDTLVEAKECYEKASELALASERKDGQVVVAATAGLAKIAAVLGETETADKLLQQANENFMSLPEEEQWGELKEKLTKSISNESRLLFLSNCPECFTDNGKNGRFSGIENRCKRC